MDKALELLIKEMKKDIRDVNEKVDRLLQFKWQIIGGSVVISIIATGLIQVLSLILKH
jgi:hypothetical protein